MRISASQAAARLKFGEVVAIPTETVYGLAASLNHPAAIEAIFALKGRPSNNPLIVHLPAPSSTGEHPMEALSSYLAQPVDGLETLVKRFWPGPLTLVLPVKTERIIPLVRANLPTSAFRMPLHSTALHILAQTGPLVAPSANRSGLPSSTCVEHVEEDFGPLFPVVDGGCCEGGVESTILILHAAKWHVGRLGAIAPETFAPLLGYVPEWGALEGTNGQVCCPGQLYRHYAPRAKLILGETDYRESDEAVVLGFSDRTYVGARRLFFLSSSNDPISALNRLYHTLRLLDQEKIPSAWVDLRIPNINLWRTLRERLIRAARG